jgi:hypothetical protein
MQFADNFEKSKDQFVALNAKAVEFAEDNTKAAFAFTREALAAKSPEALWSLQQSFLKSQQEAAVRQTEAFGKFYADWLKQSSAPLADAFKPFMGKVA